MAHEIIRRAAQKAGLKCARSTVLVEVVRGSGDEVGMRTAVLCADAKSPTGATAVVNYHGRIRFLPFGRRHDHRAWAVSRFLHRR